MRSQVLHKFLQEFGDFDWDQYCLSLHGPVSLAYLQDPAGAGFAAGMPLYVLWPPAWAQHSCDFCHRNLAARSWHAPQAGSKEQAAGCMHTQASAASWVLSQNLPFQCHVPIRHAGVGLMHPGFRSASDLSPASSMGHVHGPLWLAGVHGHTQLPATRQQPVAALLWAP